MLTNFSTLMFFMVVFSPAFAPRPDGGGIAVPVYNAVLSEIDTIAKSSPGISSSETGSVPEPTLAKRIRIMGNGIYNTLDKLIDTNKIQLKSATEVLKDKMVLVTFASVTCGGPWLSSLLAMANSAKYDAKNMRIVWVRDSDAGDDFTTFQAILGDLKTKGATVHEFIVDQAYPTAVMSKAHFFLVGITGPEYMPKTSSALIKAAVTALQTIASIPEPTYLNVGNNIPSGMGKDSSWDKWYPMDILLVTAFPLVALNPIPEPVPQPGAILQRSNSLTWSDNCKSLKDTKFYIVFYKEGGVSFLQTLLTMIDQKKILRSVLSTKESLEKTEPNKDEPNSGVPSQMSTESPPKFIDDSSCKLLQRALTISENEGYMVWELESSS